MAKRIAYEEHPTRENTMISRTDFVSQRNGAKYKVVLDMDNMVFMIRNERKKEFIYKSGQYKSNNSLKHAARIKLSRLGVELGKESRYRTFGKVEKGMTQEKWIKEEN